MKVDDYKQLFEDGELLEVRAIKDSTNGVLLSVDKEDNIVDVAVLCSKPVKSLLTKWAVFMDAKSNKVEISKDLSVIDTECYKVRRK